MSISEVDEKLLQIANNMQYVYEAGVKDFAKTPLTVRSSDGGATITSTDVSTALGTDIGRGVVDVAEIPQSVRIIGDAAFSHFPELRLILPLWRENNVQSVGEEAFKGTNIKRLDLRNCKHLGKNFTGCLSSLTNLILSKNVDVKCLDEAFEDGAPPNALVTHWLDSDRTAGMEVYTDETGFPVYAEYAASTSDTLYVRSDNCLFVKEAFIDGQFSSYALYLHCSLGKNALSKLSGMPLRILSLYGVDRVISQYYNSENTYVDNKNIKANNITIFNSYIIKNALRDLDNTKTLRLVNCSLDVNACRGNAFDKLTLTNLRNLNANSFLNTYAETLEVNPGTGVEGFEFRGVDLSSDGGISRFGHGIAYASNGSGYDSGTLITVILPRLETSLHLHNNTIGVNAILDINHLEHIGITSTVRKIGTPFAKRCPNLRGISVSGNGQYKLHNGYLYTFDLKTLMRALPASPDMSLSENITRIEHGAFADGNWGDITLPSTLQYIADDAFADAIVGILKVPYKFFTQATTTNCFGVKKFTALKSY